MLRTEGKFTRLKTSAEADEKAITQRHHTETAVQCKPTNSIRMTHTFSVGFNAGIVNVPMRKTDRRFPL